MCWCISWNLTAPILKSGLRFAFSVIVSTFFEVRESSESVFFSHSQNGHFWCSKWKSDTAFIDLIFPLLLEKKHIKNPFRPLESGFLALASEWKGFFSFYVTEKIQASQKRKDFTTICIRQNLLIGETWLQIRLWILKLLSFICLFVYLFVCISRFANFDVVSSLLGGIAIYNFDLFHAASAGRSLFSFSFYLLGLTCHSHDAYLFAKMLASTNSANEALSNKALCLQRRFILTPRSNSPSTCIL